MKIDLKDFQERAVTGLLKHVRNARAEVLDGDPQAIILSSPTGSGKTVTVTTVMERIFSGSDSQPADPKATFLWLSDSPELNRQSRDKIAAQSSEFRPRDLIIIEPPYSREKFEPGKIHFLNTQKLGKDTLLTKTGDGREYTIWNTVQNTAKSIPAHFYLVIDEAHRGMNLSTREIKRAQTIVQRFLLGDADIGLSPVPIVIGITATPERFVRATEGTGRTQRPYVVSPAEVRESGLIKDRIVLFVPENGKPSDWNLLSEAARRWVEVVEEWQRYSKSQSLKPVQPVLVVQVTDGTGDKVISRTNLNIAVETLEQQCGTFGLGELAHCFEIEGPIDAGGYQLRKIDASKIQGDPAVRIVFFKMALSTGWDCPRAEVMMSFRRAKDHTSIAQLVGRMVRAPLARRVERSELLNRVSLYHPHYDRKGLAAIVRQLNDPENAPPTEIVDGSNLQLLKRNSDHVACFEVLENLPSYFVERIPKLSHTRRFIKLARQLTLDEVAPKAWSRAKLILIKTLARELDQLRAKPEFSAAYRGNQYISVRAVQVESGNWKEVGDDVIQIEATPENINDLFEKCGRMLGEGLHKEFWKQMADRRDPVRAKLELFGVLQDEQAWKQLEVKAQQQLEALFDGHADAIRALPTSRREEYSRLRRRAKEPETVPLLLPDTVELKREEPLWKHHLYVNDNGDFGWHANTWEEHVLEEAIRQEGFIAWLRNPSRKSWSLVYPARSNVTKIAFQRPIENEESTDH